MRAFILGFLAVAVLLRTAAAQEATPGQEPSGARPPDQDVAPLPPSVEDEAPPTGRASRSVWRPALTVSDEVSVLTGLAPEAQNTANIALVQPSLAWRRGEKARAVTSLSGILLSENHSTTSRLRVREAYAGTTVGNLDFALGKKMLRWSNGYAFTPAGVLDPPRRAADPTDRLGLNEGRGLALVSFVAGRHALTLAWASAGLVEQSRPGLREITALRYNALVHGIDTSVIVAYRRGLGAFAASTFSAIVGSAIEIHGDLAFGSGADVLDRAPSLPLSDRRRLGAVLGVKISMPSRISTVLELSSADGLVPAGIDATLANAALPAVPTERRSNAFIHVGKSRLRELPGWRDWDLGAALLLGLSDGGRMLIVDLEHRVGQRFGLHGRVSLSGGSSERSEYGMIPWTSQISVGLRFQM